MRKSRKAVGLIYDAVRFELAILAGESDGTRPAFAAQAARQWLRALGANPLPPIRGRILISAMRNWTWMEWAGYCACVLRRMGFASTLVYRSSQVARCYKAPRPFNFWAKLAGIPDIELLDLDAIAPDLAQIQELRPIVEATAAASLAYDLHVEEHDVLSDPERYSLQREQSVGQWVRQAAAFSALLPTRQFVRFLCWSGLIAESPAFLAIARARGLSTVCLEGWGWRPGHMIYNLNAPALEYNVSGWLRAAGPWDEGKEKEINSYLKFLNGEHYDSSRWLENFCRMQKDKTTDTLPRPLQVFLTGPEPVFIMAPNVIGDSSMLRRETIFAGQQVWMRELIAWFSRHPQAKLIIRAHPGEVWMGQKCAVHMGPVARRAARSVPNVFVIDGEDKMNTFSLIPHARAGLAWLSSAGVDFVVRGLPTMVAARPKYEGMGIVFEPTSRVEYFATLERWLHQPERPTLHQVLQGRRYLHVVFKGFSFEAGGRNYRATGCLIDRMPNQAEHDRFYRILVGDEPMPDVST